MDITEDTSDGYHTFRELYEHRTLLFGLLVRPRPADAVWRPWKARQHHDGTMYPGFFIAGVTTDQGDATYHCRDQFWDLFDVPELECAPEFDGHSPADTLKRLRAAHGA